MLFMNRTGDNHKLNEQGFRVIGVFCISGAAHCEKQFPYGACFLEFFPASFSIANKYRKRNEEMFRAIIAPLHICIQQELHMYKTRNTGTETYIAYLRQGTSVVAVCHGPVT